MFCEMGCTNKPSLLHLWSGGGVEGLLLLQRMKDLRFRPHNNDSERLGFLPRIPDSVGFSSR